MRTSVLSNKTDIAAASKATSGLKVYSSSWSMAVSKSVQLSLHRPHQKSVLFKMPVSRCVLLLPMVMGKAVTWLNSRRFWQLPLERTLLNRAVPWLSWASLEDVHVCMCAHSSPWRSFLGSLVREASLLCRALLLTSEHLYMRIFSYSGCLLRYLSKARHSFRPWKKHTTEIQNCTNKNLLYKLLLDIYLQAATALKYCNFI